PWLVRTATRAGGGEEEGDSPTTRGGTSRSPQPANGPRAAHGDARRRGRGGGRKPDDEGEPAGSPVGWSARRRAPEGARRRAKARRRGGTSGFPRRLVRTATRAGGGEDEGE